MKIIQNLNEYFSDTPCAVTIGKFDGVHRGHRELIRNVVGFAEQRRAEGTDTQAVVIALDSGHPMLLTVQERREYLDSLGVDVLVECRVDKSFLAMTAEEFVSVILKKHLRCSHAAVGEDFRFGCGRTGDGAMLTESGVREGFTVSVIPELYSGEEIISSTLIRASVQNGEMERAAELLGYPYSLAGEVIHGKALGRTIGVPTANFRPEARKLLPPNGVYYIRSELCGRTLYGVTNIGTKPTVSGNEVGVETCYFDCDEDLYGKELKVSLMHFARPERKFEDLDALRTQISRDEKGAREYFKHREM